MEDSYLSVNGFFEAIYKEKGSKFLAYLSKVDNEQEVALMLKKVKDLHPKARHFCYAYSIGINRETSRSNDDGEPAGTAGKPIMNQILSANLKNVFIVVVRYFGGTLLGTSGLIKAYKLSSEQVIKLADIQTYFFTKKLEISFHYIQTNLVMKLIKDLKIKVLNQEFGEENFIKVEVNLNTIPKIEKEFLEIGNVRLIFFDK